MQVVGETGYAVLTRGEAVTFEWNISDFFSLSDKVDNCYHSPFFSFAESRWYLRLYPNGKKACSSEGWVDLFLMRDDPGLRRTTVHYTLAIKQSDGKDKKTELKYEFSKKNEGWGQPKIWSRSELSNRKSTLIPNNVLTVMCDLRSNALSAVKGEKKLGKSLLTVLERGDDSDVVIKVQGKEFPAHRVILRARSPVFRSMFTHDMVEKRSNVVKIGDCDPKTFSDFLVHIYSGSCESISMRNVYNLYTTADKYDVGELKEMCAEFLQRNLTVACFCAILTFAVKYNEKELIACATKFFYENSLEIVKTAEWPTFLAENISLGKELIIKALSK